MDRPWGHIGQSWGNLGAGVEQLGAYFVLHKSNVTLLKCKSRSRSAPVQSNRVCVCDDFDDLRVTLCHLWGHLGQSLCNLGNILDALRAIWVVLGAILGHPGAILGLAWNNLGLTWSYLGPMSRC